MSLADLVENKTTQQTSLDSLIASAESQGFKGVYIKLDPETGLKAIVTVHNTDRGPAIGGCRCIPYTHFHQAFEDALRLAQMMSYKAAACDLPHGGAKSVILQPPVITDREAFFKSFGRFVHQLQGQYIVAEDSGTTPADMDIISQVTPFVTCTTSTGGNPAPYTALGVLRGIQAAVQFKLGRSDLKGLKVAIQGTGHVGYLLAKMLSERGAQLFVSDFYSDRLVSCIKEFNATAVNPDDIYDVDCDVFAPCALGAIINTETVYRLKASIVAGSANNQLALAQHGQLLHGRGILYAPDFIINSGGLIYASAMYTLGDVEKAKQKIEGLYETLWHLFARAESEKIATSILAETIALEKLKEKVTHSN